jgi:hypothetical protein
MKEFNFVFQLPKCPGGTETFYVIPSSLQMGLQNSPAYFCTGTEAARTLFKRLLALTFTTDISVVYRHESYCQQTTSKRGSKVKSDSSELSQCWSEPSSIAVLCLLQWHCRSSGPQAQTARAGIGSTGCPACYPRSLPATRRPPTRRRSRQHLDQEA